MKTRLQDFYNYIFRNDWANPERDLVASSAEDKEKQIQTRISNMQKLFNTETISASDQTNFRMALRLLKASHLEKALFGNTTDELKSDYKFPSENKMRAKFLALENKYNYFLGAKAQEITFKKFQELFLISKIIADFVEHTNKEPDDVVAYLHAYKLLVVFSEPEDKPQETFQLIDTYLQKHNYLNIKHRLQDALVIDIPGYTSERQIKKLPAWRSIIQSSGSKGFALLNRALEIEAKLTEQFPKESEQKEILANYNSAMNYAKSVIYKYHKEYEELAELFLSYNIPNRDFDIVLKIDKKRKKVDYLPDTIINGAEIDLPGYYLVKLPLNLENPNDKYRALAYVKHINRHSQSHRYPLKEYSIDGITSPYNGFLLLLKDEMTVANIQKSNEEKKPSQLNVKKLLDDCRIVGQGNVWFTNWGNLAIDSWDNLNEEDNPVATRLLRKYAENFIADKNLNVLQVSISSGGKNPKHEFIQEVSPAGMVEGSQYADAMNQVLISIDENTQNKLYEDLQTELTNIIHEKIDAKANLSDLIQPKHIISLLHAKTIKNIFKDEKYQQFLQKNYEKLRIKKEDPALYTEHLWSILGLLCQSKTCPSEAFLNIFTEYTPLWLKYKTSPMHHYILLEEQLIYRLGKENLLDEKILELIYVKNDSTYFIEGTEPIIPTILNNIGFINQGDQLSMENRLELLDAFLAKGANPNEKTPSGNTALGILFQEIRDDKNLIKYKLEIVTTLLNHGADPNLEDSDGALPLLRAYDPESIKLLLAAKADPNKFSNYSAEKRTVLQYAVGSSSPRIDYIKQLLEAKADQTLTTKDGLTPLHIILKDVRNFQDQNQDQKISTIAKTLIEYRANLNAQTESGDTPLHLAYEYGHKKLIQLLLDNGAKPDIKNKSGRTPSDLNALGMNEPTVNLVWGAFRQLLQRYLATDDLYRLLPVAIFISPQELPSAEMAHELVNLCESNSFSTYFNESKKTDLLDKFKYINKDDKNLIWIIFTTLNQNNLCTTHNLNSILNNFINKYYADENHENIIALDLVIKELSAAKLLNQENFNKLSPDICKDLYKNPSLAASPSELIATINDTKYRDKNGCTQVFNAAKEGDIVTLKLLAERKADLTQPNYFGCTPFDIATYRNKKEVLALLAEYKVTAPLERKNDFTRDYVALYDTETVFREYTKETKSEELELQRKNFQEQFKILLEKIKQWGLEKKHGCENEQLTSKIDSLKRNFFSDNYSGDQPPIFFNTIKQNLEKIWFILQEDKSILDKKKIAEFKQLCNNMLACAPGFYTHVEHVLNNLTAKVAIDYWLAELRTSIINQYADKHVREQGVSDSFSPHVFGAFLIYGLNEGWAPLSKITKDIELFSDSPPSRIRSSTYDLLTEHFEASYTPQAITDCVTTNAFLAIKKICDDLSLKEEKGKGIPATPEFINEIKKLANTLNLKAEDISFLDFSDDGKYAQFNSDMFRSIFLRSCKENSTYFSKDSWREISLSSGYKFHNCKHQLGWFEKEDKPNNQIINWKQLQDDIEPAILLGKLLAQLPTEELTGILHLHHMINSVNDLAKFLSQIPKTSSDFILNNFLGKKQVDNIIISNINQNNVDGIKILFNQHPNFLYSILDDKTKHNAIFLATELCHVEMIKALYDCKAKIDQLDDQQKTPLMIAYKSKKSDRLAALRMLLDCKADGTINHGDSIFHASVNDDDLSTLKLLAEYTHLDCNKKNYSPGATPAHYAVQKNRINCLKELMKLPDINFTIKDLYEKSALNFAIKDKKWDMLVLMLMTMKPSSRFNISQEEQNFLYNSLDELTNAYIKVIKEIQKDDRPQKQEALDQVINRDNLLGIILNFPQKTFLSSELESSTVSENITRIMREFDYKSPAKEQRFGVR